MRKLPPDVRRANKIAQGKAYYAAHAEEKRANQREYNAKNTERINQRLKALRLADPEKYKARAKRNYEKHKAKILAARKAYVAANPEKVAASINASRRAHPDTTARRWQRRRAHEKAAPINDLTAKEWQEIKAAYRHCCVYCGRRMQRLTQDHLTPLSTGGSHTKQNVVPACHSCNARKNAGPVLCPVQPLLL